MRVERRITITTVAGDVLIEFMERADRTWKPEYHMWIEGDRLTTVRVIELMRAWV